MKLDLVVDESEVVIKKETLSTMIFKYIKDRELSKLDLLMKDAAKKRKDIFDQVKLATFELDVNNKIVALQDSFLPYNWITNAAMRAKQIRLVTHALKFTHTDAKGSSIYPTVANVVPYNSKFDGYLSTANINFPELDAVGNAAALDVAKLLQLESDAGRLIDYIARDDGSPLQPFATSEKQLEQWMIDFKLVLVESDKSSHTLAKQIFFPISDGEYHLLGPIYATSLAHELYKKVTKNRYSEEYKSARKAKREGKYSSLPTIDYPNTAIQGFGGTKPQNVSQLNSSRGGKSYLLSCAPPSWITNMQPPIKTRSIFHAEYGRRARPQIRTLQKYLERLSDKRSTKPRRDQRAEYIDELIDLLFIYAAEVKNIPPGWSMDSKLPLEQQLWLDPKRSEFDEEFKQNRDLNKWQQEISDQFAVWLNSKIRSDKLTMGDAEYSEWKWLVENKLRLLKDDLYEVVA